MVLSEVETLTDRRRSGDKFTQSSKNKSGRQKKLKYQ